MKQGLGREWTLALTNVASEIADALETMDRSVGQPAWKRAHEVEGAEPTPTPDELWSTLQEVNGNLERALHRVLDVLAEGKQV